MVHLKQFKLSAEVLYVSFPFTLNCVLVSLTSYKFSVLYIKNSFSLFICFYSYLHLFIIHIIYTNNLKYRSTPTYISFSFGALTTTFVHLVKTNCTYFHLSQIKNPQTTLIYTYKILCLFEFFPKCQWSCAHVLTDSELIMYELSKVKKHILWHYLSLRALYLTTYLYLK